MPATHRALTSSLVAVSAAYAAGAWVGLPLFADGALYYAEILLEQAPLIPNWRFSALLAQLPVLAGLELGAPPMLLPRLFGLGYAALPVLSLWLCWRWGGRDRPELLLFPVLFLVANQINFSSVSELLLCLYLSWPGVFLILLARPPAALAYALLLVPLLGAAHPLAFLALSLLAGLAVARARADTRRRSAWLWLALGLGLFALLRLGWTLWSGNEYERSHFTLAAAPRYLLPVHPASRALLFACGSVAAGVALASLFASRRARLGPERATAGWWRRGALVLIALALGLPSLALVAAWFGGAGIQLKAGLVFPLGLGLMILVVPLARAPPSSASCGRAARALARVGCALIVLLMLTKTLLWWRATATLAAFMAASEASCIRFEPAPPDLFRSAPMAIVTNWTTPFAALVFRGGEPLPLLLPDPGCARLAVTGSAALTPWFSRSVAELAAAFGPLRAHDSSAAPVGAHR